MSSTTKKIKETVKQAKTTVKQAEATVKKAASKAKKKLSSMTGQTIEKTSGKKTADTAKKTSLVKKDTPVVVEPRETAWAMKLERVAGVLDKHGFATSVVGTLAEAADVVMKDILPISQAKIVSFGGSMTVLQAGLLDALKHTKGLSVLDTFDYSIGAEAMLELRRQSLLSDLYITSVNALTEDGMLMLLDGTGNRAAAVQFGPKKVVLIIGRNKICSNMEEGMARVRNLAAPANAIRLKKKTPCTKTGICMDCASPDRICSSWTMTVRSAPKERIHVILVNEEVGY